LRGAFVTGTDTGAGKTYVTAALAGGLIARGERVCVRKPLLTGLGEPDPDGHPFDHEVLAGVTGEAPEQVAPIRFQPAVSPHLAAELAGVTIDTDAVVAQTLAARGDADALIVEGVGGLLVPLSETETVRDLALGLGLPVVIAARPGLGTISHCLLTVEVARAAGLDVRLIVMGPWPVKPSQIESDNRAMVERITGLPVATIGKLDPRSAAGFISEGEKLPLSAVFAD
jgi:dethiobiotin synthetase